MGILINGQTDTISASDGSLNISDYELSVSSSINITGIITAGSFVGNLTGNLNSSGVNTATTISGTTATYATGNLTTANITTGNIVTGIVTTLSGTTATYATGNLTTANITTGNIVTGIVTTLSGTTATYTTFNGNVNATTGVSTFTNVVVAAGSTAAPSITPTGDSNTGIFFPSADTIAIAEGGTEALRIDSSGRVTKPYQPAFLAYNSTGVAVGGGWSNLSSSITTEAYDIGGNYGTSTAGRFVAPVAGRYLFYFGGFSVGNTIDARYAVSATVNGGSQSYIGGGNYSLVDTPLSGYSIIHNLSVNDYVELFYFSAIATTWGGGHYVYWGGYLLG